MESCLGSFPKPGLSHSSLVAFWLFLWSLHPGHGCLPLSCSSCSAETTAILQGKCQSLSEQVCLPQHHPNTLSTEDPFQTPREKSLALPPLWLRTLLTATSTEVRAGQAEGADIYVCIRREASDENLPGSGFCLRIGVQGWDWPSLCDGGVPLG